MRHNIENKLLILIAIVMLLLPIIRIPVISHTVNQGARPNYMVVMRTSGGNYCTGCPVGCTPYEEAQMTTTRQYFYDELINWLEARDKNVEVHDVIKEIANHDFDLAWLSNTLYSYLENPPPYGVLVVFGRHGGDSNVLMYSFSSTVQYKGARFPSQWARPGESLTLLASYVGRAVREKDFTELPALVIMYDCNTAGTMENGVPKPSFSQNTWLWAYKFDDRTTWVRYISGIEYDRAFIGWLTVMKISAYGVYPDVDAVTKALKYSITYGLPLMYSLDHYIRNNGVRVGVYYDYIKNNVEYVESIGYNGCNDANCPWIAYIGGYNVFLDPTHRERLIDYSVNYLRTYYPSLYNLIVSDSSVYVGINDLYNLTLDKYTKINAYLITWRSSGKFSVSFKIYCINDTLIPAGVSIFYDELSEVSQKLVLNKTLAKINNEINKYSGMLDKLGISLLSKNSSSKDRWFSFMYKGKPIIILRDDPNLYVALGGSIRVDVTGFGGAASIDYTTDYYLLKYIFENYLVKRIDNVNISEKIAVNKAFWYLKNYVPYAGDMKYNISTSTFWLIYGKQLLPAYYVKLTNDNAGVEYDFIVDGIKGVVLRSTNGVMASASKGYNSGSSSEINVVYSGQSDHATVSNNDNPLELLLVIIPVVLVIIGLAIYIVKRRSK